MSPFVSTPGNCSSKTPLQPINTVSYLPIGIAYYMKISVNE